MLETPEFSIKLIREWYANSNYYTWYAHVECISCAFFSVAVNDYITCIFAMSPRTKKTCIMSHMIALTIYWYDHFWTIDIVIAAQPIHAHSQPQWFFHTMRSIFACTLYMMTNFFFNDKNVKWSLFFVARTAYECGK